MSINISVLASGSSGNSIYIKNGKNQILIDAGLSGKELTNRLKKIQADPAEIDAVFLTHEHNDHIDGAGVISRRFDIPIYATEKTWQAASSELGQLCDKDCRILEKDMVFGSFGVHTFSVSHDASDPVGYILHCNNKKIGIATDMGYFDQNIVKELKGMDVLIIEANHDLDMLINGSYPWSVKKRIKSRKGHLSNDDTAALLPEVISDNIPRILLAHLSQDNNNPELAYITIKNNLEYEGLKEGEDYKLDFTYQKRPTRLFQV
ncbi:MAG: MBL fold metallo-hydrolase [Halanaerobiales bacterium]